jgi:hypothetical protein
VLSFSIIPLKSWFLQLLLTKGSDAIDLGGTQAFDATAYKAGHVGPKHVWKVWLVLKAVEQGKSRPPPEFGQES